MNSFNKILKCVFILCSIIAAILFLFVTTNIGINLTPSYPLGVYKSHKIEDPATCKNQLVLVCPDPQNPAILEAIENRLLPHGTSCENWDYAPLMKELVGVPGDTVTVNNQGITAINGKQLDNSKIKFEIFELLIHPGYTYTLRSGEYWVMSDYNPNSLDSRYIGPVLDTQIIKCSKPVVTWD